MKISKFRRIFGGAWGLVLILVSSLTIGAALIYPLLFGAKSKSKNELNPQIVAKVEKSHELIRKASQLRHENGKLVEAESLFRQAIELQPKSSFAWIGLAQVLDQQGKASEAQSAYKTLVGDHPDWGSTMARDTTVLIRFAELSEQVGKQEDADWAYGIILETGDRDLGGHLPLVPEKYDSRATLRAGAYVVAGIQFSKRRNGEEAMLKYREALDRDPSFAHANFYLGYELLRGGQSEEAKLFLIRARELAKTDDRVVAAANRELSKIRP